MFKDVVVLGGGSAGLMAALALRTKIPGVTVTVLRSPEIGVIRVGESTTPFLPYFLFEYLGLNRRRFYEIVNPTWKMGVHFIWGPRKVFQYPFEPQLELQMADMPRPNGFYCDEDFSCVSQQAALMEAGKAFIRQPNGAPGIRARDPFHLDNPKYVAALETYCVERGIAFVDGKMKETQKGPEGIAALVLEDGRRITGDFFVDASGFRSELLGRAMGEPFVSYSASLFNDRAIVGDWERGDDPILPYTVAETMDAGWCWRIEHVQHVNRGYAYCSNFISDDAARDEFLRKNPKAKTWDRVIKFKPGRYQRAWVGNVMGIGNACGFVEPLESSALMVAAEQCETFCEMVGRTGVTPSMEKMFNEEWAHDWDEIRDFLTLHFWPNTMIDTPYWRHCHNETDISRLKPLLEFYEENGPSLFAKNLLRSHGNQYGIEGFLVQLVGNKVPYRNRHVPTQQEVERMAAVRAHFRAVAKEGVCVKEALTYIRHPNWRWAEEM